MDLQTFASLPRRVALFALLALGLVAPAGADTGVIKLLVPAPAGGTMDVVARMLAEQLSADTGKTAIVENKPGAGGTIAIQAMLAAPPDGQTLMVTASNVLTEIPHVLKSRYDLKKDVKPVIAVVRSNLLLVAAPDFGPKDLKSVISYARERRGRMSYATYGVGTVAQFAGAMLNQKEGLDMQHIPFLGSSPALPQVMGGQIPLMFDGTVTSLPYITSGKLQVYAVATATRSPLLPKVPTFAELGYPDIDFNNWVGVIVAGGTSDAVTEQVHAMVSKAASVTRIRERFMALGFDIMPPMTSAALAQSVRTDYDRYGQIVKTFNIKLD